MRDHSPLFDVLDRVIGPHSPFTVPERMVAVAIAKRFGGKVRAWPSLSTLAADTSLCQTAVRAALDRLCDSEQAIFTRVRGGSDPGGRRHPAEYVLRAARARDSITSRQGDHITSRQGHKATVSRGDNDPITTRMHEQLNEPVQRKQQNPPNPPLPRGAEVEAPPAATAPPAAGPSPPKEAPTLGAKVAGPSPPRGARRFDAALDALAELVQPFGVATDRRWRRLTVDRLQAGADVEQLVDEARQKYAAAAEDSALEKAFASYGTLSEMATAACDFIQAHRETPYRAAKQAWALSLGLRDDVALWMQLRPLLEAEERRRGIRESEEARGRQEFGRYRDALRGEPPRQPSQAGGAG